ncbi:unnamed protein product [Effrenium voratum]|nr:unnamed protein product [Effrenium voratum]
MGVTSKLLGLDASLFLLPSLSMCCWTRLACTCSADLAALKEVQALAKEAFAPGAALPRLVAKGLAASAALRLLHLAAVDARAMPMPVLVSAVYSWAHLGLRNGRKPKRRSEHVALLAHEFANGIAPQLVVQPRSLYGYFPVMSPVTGICVLTSLVGCGCS